MSSTYDFEEEGATVADNDGWETNGPNRLVKRFYFHEIDKYGVEEPGDSRLGSLVREGHGEGHFGANY